jgi:DNA polymerase III delta prime subunit
LKTLHFPDNGTVMLIGNTLETVAIHHAKELLCRDQARSEALFNNEVHPDFKLLRPEKAEGALKIEEVRDLISWNRGKPQIAKKKVAIISPAHALNLQAANALLKTLEEPSLDSLFILVTNKPGLLPATIRSRCHKIVFRDAEEVLLPQEFKNRILQDLKALKLQKTNPIILTEHWVKQEPKLVLDAFYVVVAETLKQSSLLLANKAGKSSWKLLDAIIEAKGFLEAKVSPNFNLLFESLLIQYLEIPLIQE